MLRRIPYFLVPLLLAVTLLGVCTGFGTSRDEKIKKDLVAYVARHDGEQFDYKSAAVQLSLTYDQLFAHLMDLERNGVITSTPRSLARKPILITRDDKIWYFWTVSLAPGK